MHRVAATLACFGLALSVISPASTPGVRHAHAAAQHVVTVRLQPVGRGRVTGTVRLIAAGAQTKAVLDVRHLPPGSDADAVVHAGTCPDLARLSASFASLPGLKANARGRATGTGWVRGPIKGFENVRLAAITGSHDVIVIELLLGPKPYRRSRLVACGAIP